MFSVPTQHTEQFVPPSTHLDPRKAFKRGPGLGSSPTAIILRAAGTCSSGGGGRFLRGGGKQSAAECDRKSQTEETIAR